MLKTVYEYVITCFHMFSQRVLEVLMSVDKLKQVDPMKLKTTCEHVISCCHIFF